MRILFLLLISFSLQAMVKVDIKREPEDAVKLLNEILVEKENPQIVLWFGGESGVNCEGLQFYKEQIFAPLNSQEKSFGVHLYALMAWKALRSKKVKLKKQDPLVGAVKARAYFPVQSAEFFDYLAQEKDPQIIQYFNEVILRRSDLVAPSVGRKPNDIAVKDVLPVESLQAIHNLDTAQAYSPLQYLECLYLIKRIAENSKGKKEIVFLLPNDEFKYYQSADLLEKDLATLIKKDVNVSFRSFIYGDDITKRPYISKTGKPTVSELEKLS